MLPAADTIRRAKYDINAGKPSVGLVIGRFIPPHRGHDYLIDEAYERSQGRLRVMVMARPDEKIPGYLRVQWLRKQHPEIGKAIQLVTQMLPEDYGSRKVWDMWIDLIQHRLYGLRVSKVFSSETYGEQLARDLGVTHELVDLAREAVNISATKIRVDYEAHKFLIAGDVYRWMKKNWDCSDPSPRRVLPPANPQGPA